MFVVFFDKKGDVFVGCPYNLVTFFSNFLQFITSMTHVHRTFTISEHDNGFPMQPFQNYTVARDTFLAHLGATLWGSMRHIISPSIADGAYHYYERISFQLFLITPQVIFCSDSWRAHSIRARFELTFLLKGKN